MVTRNALWSIVCLALAAGCTSELSHDNAFDPEAPVEKQARASLRGKVTLEQDGDPRSATVTVKFDGGQVLINPEEDGSFTLGGIPPGARTVSFDAPHYKKAEREVVFEIGEDEALNDVVTLEIKRVAVRGSVTVESQGAFSTTPGGAAVTLRQVKSIVKKAVAVRAAADEETTEPGNTFSTTTQSDGTYQFSDVPAGVYEATAGKDDAGAEPIEVTVDGEGAVTVAELVLKPLTGDFSIVGGLYTTTRNIDLSLLGFNADQAQVGEERNGVCAYPAAPFAYTVQATYQLDDYDGEHVICVRFSDLQGRQTADYKRIVRLDRQAPSLVPGSPAVAFEDGQYTNDGTTLLALAAGGADQLRVTDAVNQTGSWVPFASKVNYALPATVDGVYVVYVTYRDLAGNESGPYAASIIRDSAAPGAGVGAPIEIDFGNPVTSSPIVQLDFDVVGATQMLVSENAAFSGAVWQPYSNALQFLLSAGNGTKTVWVKFRDAAGNQTAAFSDTITLDTRPISSPYVNIQQSITSATTVDVQLSAGEYSFEAGTQMWLSMQSDFSGGTGWIAYSPFTTYTFTPGDGRRFLYAKFKKQSGTTSGTVADYFDLDTAGPEYSSVSVAGGALYVPANQVTLNLTATDVGSGVESMMIAEEPTFASAVKQPFVLALVYPFISGSEGLKTVYVKYFDRAGNVSAVASVDVIVDTIDPVISLFQVEDGAANALTLTNLTRVTVHAQASDASPLQMLVSSRNDFLGSAWQPYQEYLMWDLLSATVPAGEARTVYLKVRDASGRVVTPAGGYGFTLDNIAPSGVSIDITGDATTSPTVDVNFTYNNADVIEIATDIGFQNKLSFSARAATTYTFGAAEGIKTLFARFKDLAGNVSEVAADQINLDSAPPQLADFSINGGTQTNQTSVTLSLTAVDAVEMQIAENSCGGAWIPFATGYAHNFTSTSEGLKTIAVRYRDSAMNPTACIIKTVTLDQSAPQITAAKGLVIAGDATYTTERAVAIAFNVTGATEVLLSENGSFVGAVWSQFGGSLSWNLSAGDGVKTLYAKFRDAAGNVTALQSDSIALDTAAPSFNAAIAPAVTNSTLIPLTLTAVGADRMRFSEDPAFPSTVWEPYSSNAAYDVSAGEGGKTVYIQLSDAAGNISIVRSFTLVLDQTAPLTPNLSALGGVYTDNPVVSLQVLANEGSQMLVSQFAAMTDSTWQPYTQLKAFTLAGLDGAKTVYVRVRDAAGNLSPIGSTTIRLDTTDPQITLFAARDSLGNNISATNQLRYYLHLAVNDASPLTVQYHSSNVFSGIPAEPVQAVRAWDVSSPVNPLGESRTVYARIVDAAGNETVVGPVNVLVDTIAPTGMTMTLSASLVSATTVGVNLSANNADYVELSGDISFLSPVRFAYQTVTAYTFPSGDGAKQLFARFIDLNGNISPVVAATTTLDQTPPQAASFVIEQGSLTSLTTVNLTLTAVDAFEMQVAENVCGGPWIPFATSFAQPFTSITEGAKTITVRFRDAALNETACLTRQITLDRSAPVFTAANVVLINGDATSTTERAVTLSFAVTDATEMLVSENPSFVGANWIPFTPTYGWVLSAGEGTKTVFAKFRDAARNETVDKSDSISFTIATPSISILSGPVTKNRTVQVQILVNNATEVLMSEIPAMTGAVWQSFANVKNFTLSDSDGTKTIYVRTRDALGNISGQASASVALDRTAPYFTAGFDPLVINNDATSTTDRAVTLSFAVTQATQMIVSEDPSFAGANWATFTFSTSWVLSAGDGQKTVYAKFQDAAGNQTVVLSDSIFIAPSTPSVTILGGAFTRFTNITLQILSSNATEVQISENPLMTGATWQPYSATKSFLLTGSDGLKSVYVRVRDGVGNVSGQAQATVTLDRVAPDVGYFEPVDAFGNIIGYSQQTRYYLAVTAADQSQPMTVQFSPINGFIGSPQLEFVDNALYPWDAEPATDPNGEVRSTYLKLIDAAGNVAYAGPVTVLVDNVGVEQVGSTIQVSPNPTSSSTVTVALSSQSAATVELSEDPNFVSPPPVLFSMRPSTTYTLTNGDGLKVLWARFKDSGGFAESPVSAATYLDTTFPLNVTFTIDEGSVAATLDIHVRSGTQGATQMQISDVGCATGAWEAFQEVKTFRFSSGVNGPRTIHARYRDNVGHITGCVAQPILLDTSRANITSISPSSGGVGELVTISGTNIGSAVGTVKFGGVAATVLSWSDTTIIVRVPGGLDVGPTTVVVIVDGNDSPEFPFTIRPGILSLQPPAAYAGGYVKALGGGFGATQGGSLITVGGIYPTVLTWSSQQIDFLVPAGVGGKNQPVAVTVDGITSNPVNLTVLPHITSITPDNGPSGTVITLSGTNFGFGQGSSRVVVGDIDVPALSWSNTSVILQVNDDILPGFVPVRIVVSGNPSNPALFEHRRPWLDAYFPNPITTGETVSLIGRYLGAVSGTVNVANLPVTITSWTSGAIEFIAPYGIPGGTLLSTIETADGVTSNALPLTVVQADRWLAFSGVEARNRFTTVWTGNEMIIWGGGTPSGASATGSRYNPATDTWLPVSTSGAPWARYNHTAVWTGSEMIIWGGWGYQDGGRYNPSTDSWVSTSLVGAPAGRDAHVAVWTGNRMIVWGGEDAFDYTNTGGIYDPVADSWVATPLNGSPQARWGATAVWTGSVMIVWGGEDNINYDPVNTGGRFNPGTMAWAPMSTVNAPTGREEHSAVWTGTEMLIFGGYNPGWDYVADGARYNPNNDTWTLMSVENQPWRRGYHQAVWTGSEMLIFGGDGEWPTYYPRDVGKYVPSTDTWYSVPDTTPNTPESREDFGAVWTGTEMVIFGGYTYSGLKPTGGRFNPVTNTWIPTSGSSQPPVGAARQAAVWTGTRALIWGGDISYQSYYGMNGTNQGAMFDPVTNEWYPMSTVSAPTARVQHSGVWTGTEMIVFGGYNPYGATYADGGRFDPAMNAWTPVPATTSVSPRYAHTAVWTGDRMIIWGGYNLGDGASYYPATGTWATLPSLNQPVARQYHTAVWTGDQMIVWGGWGFDPSCGCSRYLNTGARYYPEANTWSPTAMTSPPTARMEHTAVWTGQEMVVWGGHTNNFYYDRTGSKYNPTTDSWTTVSEVNHPTGRFQHSALWSGKYMVVWGGYDEYCCQYTSMSGGRYDPVSDTWLSTTMVNAPQARRNHAALWTGKEMLIWSGEYHYYGYKRTDGARYYP